jgi:hypothetical protein
MYIVVRVAQESIVEREGLEHDERSEECSKEERVRQHFSTSAH